MAAVAAVGLAAGLAQTLITALQTKQLKEMCSLFGCYSQLEKLQHTMSTIKALLLDVESKHQDLTHEGQLWVEKLKEAVYDVDDLLDEFATFAQQRNQIRYAKLSRKLHRFFSRNNNYFVAFNISREIKLLREKLDAIVKNHADFGFTDVNRPAKRREETCSYVFEEDVIGREDEKEAIVGLLLSDSHSSYHNISFVNIVGIGGLGKTTLAQVVYNDQRIKMAFSLRIWVCVSEEFGVKEVLGKILGEEELTFEETQRKVRTLLERKRYLLVLDDVWNEDHEKWLRLSSFLVSDVSGSKIIVTSRSKKVARAIGEGSIMYELKGLLEENSWRLFKRVALAQREDQANFCDIGKDIVKKCANVPLSIRVIGSMLYDQEESKWLWFRSIDLADMSGDEDYIMSTLMFSYHHLTPKLKSCFSFCSLFSKDYVIQKKLLINLWLAQGFLVTTDQLQSIEDVGEHYFTVLLNRCFFQDIKFDEHGDVHSCKMHDLMHDLALKVAGKESLIMKGGENHFGRKIRHLSLVSSLVSADACVNNWSASSYCSGDKLRTFFQLKYNNVSKFSNLSKEVDLIISNCRRLRVLDLYNVGFRTVTKKVGKLLHLRYLDLSVNIYLEMLPNTITKLHNLQILKLCGCMNLKELPDDTSKLVNLRTLDISGCDKLTHMPRGMNNLRNLHMLPLFVVGGVDLKQIRGSKLVDLKALTSLKGDLCIRIWDFSSNNVPQPTDRAFILKDASIRNLEIRCSGKICGQSKPFLRHYREEDDGFEQSQVHESLLEDLCPNHDVSMITLIGYDGTKLPSWASMMVSVELSNIAELQCLTSLSRLHHLKILKLQDLCNVEYIETDALSVLVTRSRDSRAFFPVLKELVVEEMPKLKGWWRDIKWMENLEIAGGRGCLVDADDEQALTLPFFPSLSVLIIKDCGSMTYFPPCPYVKKLDLQGISEALTFCMKGGIIPSAVMCSTNASSRSWSSSSSVPVLFCLEKLTLKDARVLNSLFREFVEGAVDIEISFNDESMGILREGFQRCASSLEHLSIHGFEVKSLRGGGIEYLTNLQSLKIEHCFKLDVEDEEEEGMPWKCLHSLSSLTLNSLRKMVNLPKGFQYLASLQSLQIENCYNLNNLGNCLNFLTSLQSLQIIWCPQVKSLPESMRHLTSLTTLVLYDPCYELKERCQEPHGQDWPNICNIPNLRIW